MRIVARLPRSSFVFLPRGGALTFLSNSHIRNTKKNFVLIESQPIKVIYGTITTSWTQRAKFEDPGALCTNTQSTTGKERAEQSRQKTPVLLNPQPLTVYLSFIQHGREETKQRVRQRKTVAELN